ncbi:hypothetical protein O6H91_19G078200 [Diphasiastrum complanatum]|uniref:Uncharacterized protein n=1 Tax=Diphasiastrum complanatum TaxID=34168 RepID=A0ACC2AX38_DIPCM|nr:hypothetical protein O6H91_19G078200 [Diphasiastrum complanatum]
MVSKKVQISQEAFDAVVKENEEDFGMELEEALADAIHTFQLQGADLAGIITDGRGAANLNEHPVVQAIKLLEAAVTHTEVVNDDSPDGHAIVEALNTLKQRCVDGPPQSIAIAGRNGAVEAIINSSNLIKRKYPAVLGLALEAFISLLEDYSNRLKFSAGGPELVVDALLLNPGSVHVAGSASAIIAIATTGNESLKQSFMDLKADEALVRLLQKPPKDLASLQKICDAVRSLVVADDESAVTSKAYSNARKFCRAGAAEAILKAISEALLDPSSSSSVLATLCVTLKALAVNDEICKTVGESGGLEFILQLTNECQQQRSKTLAKSACALLGQLAGRDANKDAIVTSGGLDRIIRLSYQYPEDPLVLQEIMTTIAIVSLRSPVNARKAVEAGAVDMATEVMMKHSTAAILQRQSCQMLRNLAARNPENRVVILEKGLPALIRNAKTNHDICKDAASAALRDLGFDDYNQ